MKASFKIKNNMVFHTATDIEVSKVLNKRLPDISNSIKPELSVIMGSALANSETVKSLLIGKLKDDFGLSGNIASTAMTNIIDYISKNITVNIKQSKKSGGILTLVVEIPTGDIKNIANLPGGSYTSKGQGKFSEGGKVDWLEWLLTKGTQVVIGDFWLYPYAKGYTRSGGSSVMLKIVNQGQPFRVDPGHAGTETDNFITRAIEPFANRMMEIARDAVSRRFK